MKAALPYGSNGWYLETSSTAILAAENPIFVDSVDELETVLIGRHPCEDSRLTRVKANGNAVVYVYDPPIYAGRDVEEFVAVLREKGELSTDGNWHFGCKVNEHPGYGVDFRAGSGNGYEWDPAGIAKSKRKARQDILKKHVRAFELQALIESFKARLPYELRLVQDVTDGRVSQVKCIFGLHRVYNGLYGRNAHRRLAGWQVFIRAWRLRRVRTLVEFAKLRKSFEGGVSGESRVSADVIGCFVDWVEGEAGKRLPAVEEVVRAVSVFALR